MDPQDGAGSGVTAGPLAKRAAPVQWIVLLVLSAVLVLCLEWLHLPAALLLGPMAAAIVVAGAESSIKTPSWAYVAAQSIIGCLIARSITPAIVTTMLRDWPVLLAMNVLVITAGAVLGWLLAKLKVFPGTTPIWGSSPGAASAMVLMAEAYGADVRLVAFMQYLRVVFVASAASAIAAFWVTSTGQEVPSVVWFPPIDPIAFGLTLALALFGALLGRRLRLPAGPLLLPLVLGSVLHGSGWLEIELPPWLLAGSYALIGWSIGLRFTKVVLFHAASALPRVATATAALIAICGGFAWALTEILGIDGLTAYLATSPGGADSVAIIAASTPNVDVPFVMALQTARLFVVILVGPALARFLADRVKAQTT